MFCRKCGKQIDYDAEVCKECQETDEFFSGAASSTQGTESSNTDTASFTVTDFEQPVQPVAPAGNKKVGFGKALASTILAGIAYFLVLIALELISEALGLNYESEYYAYATEVVIDSDMMIIALVLTAIGIALSIPALIMGIQSMKCFFRQKREGKVKPIPTLVLGIVGLALSAMVLSFSLLIIAAAVLTF